MEETCPNWVEVCGPTSCHAQLCALITDSWRKMAKFPINWTNRGLKYVINRKGSLEVLKSTAIFESTVCLPGSPDWKILLECCYCQIWGTNRRLWYLRAHKSFGLEWAWSSRGRPREVRVSEVINLVLILLCSIPEKYDLIIRVE